MYFEFGRGNLHGTSCVYLYVHVPYCGVHCYLQLEEADKELSEARQQISEDRCATCVVITHLKQICTCSCLYLCVSFLQAFEVYYVANIHVAVLS